MYLLPVYPHQRKNPIQACAEATQSLGFRVFALKAGGHCHSSEDAETLYLGYARTDRCWEGGLGGQDEFEVYIILSAPVDLTSSPVVDIVKKGLQFQSH